MKSDNSTPLLFVDKKIEISKQIKYLNDSIFVFNELLIARINPNI